MFFGADFLYSENEKNLTVLLFYSIQDRLEIILDTWIEYRHVPCPAEVSKLEGIDFLSKGKASLLVKAPLKWDA